MRTTITTTTIVAYIFFDAWAIKSDKLSYLFTEIGSQIVSESFGILCIRLSKKFMTATACHPHTNRLIKRNNKTIVTLLCNPSTRLKFFVQPLAYANNKQTYWSAYTTPFILVLTRHSPGRTTFDSPSVFATSTNHTTDPQAFGTQLLARFKVLQMRVKNVLTWRKDDVSGTTTQRFVALRRFSLAKRSILKCPCSPPLPLSIPR